MSVNKKWISYIFIVGLLINPLVSLATSKNSEESKQTETSTNELTTMSSSVLGGSNEMISSEEDPSTEDQEKEVIAEQTYEERDLSKKDNEDDVHPIVKVERNAEFLDGEIVLDSKSKNQSKTILQKAVLESKSDKSEWYDEKVFEVSENHVLNERSFRFESNDLTDDQNYRLILDYFVEEMREDKPLVRTIHKGYFILEESASEKEKLDASVSKLNTPPDSSNDSNNSTTVESFRAEIPKKDNSIQVSPRNAQLLSSTRADILYNGYPEYNYSISQGYQHVYIQNITKNSAKIDVFSSDFSGLPSLGGTYRAYLCKDNSSIPTGTLKLTASQVSTLKQNAVGYVDLRRYSNYVTGVGTINNLKPNTYYHILLTAEASNGTATFIRVPGLTLPVVGDMYTPVGYFSFVTADPSPLTITAPTFTQASATAIAIPMVGKSYTGDIFQTSGQGKVQVTSNDGSTIQDKVTNVGHTITENGSYNNATVSGLT
ncbi:hypothetical protein, partial [Candidatus Enterococcus murrayae]